MEYGVMPTCFSFLRLDFVPLLFVLLGLLPMFMGVILFLLLPPFSTALTDTPYIEYRISNITSNLNNLKLQTYCKLKLGASCAHKSVCLKNLKTCICCVIERHFLPP